MEGLGTIGGLREEKVRFYPRICRNFRPFQLIESPPMEKERKEQEKKTDEISKKEVQA